MDKSIEQIKQSRTHIRHKIFSLGNPFERKPSWKVRLLRSLSMYVNMAADRKR